MFQGFQQFQRVPKASFCCGSGFCSGTAWNTDRTKPLELLEVLESMEPL
jgi:hypothetical protein